MIRRLVAFLALPVIFAAPAHADPDVVSNYAAYNAGRVCRTLDSYPTLPGVAGVLDGIQSDTGFSDYNTGRVIALAVTANCPWHWPLLKRFAYTVGGSGVAV